MKKKLSYATRTSPKSPSLGLGYVDLVGLSRILSPRSSITRRVLWSLAIAFGAILTAYYTWDRLQYFRSDPVSVSIRTYSNSRTIFPDITVCVKQKYDYHRLMKLWKEKAPGSKMPGDADLRLLDIMNATLSEIWTEAGYVLDKLVKKCYVGPGKLCKDEGKWNTVFTRYGLCYTFSGAATQMDGIMFGIYLQIKHRGHPYGNLFWGYQIGVHGSHDPVSTVIDDGFPCSFKKNQACFVLLSIKVKDFVTKNTHQNPCKDDPDYNQLSCRAGCLYASITEQVGCRLPYMQVAGRECRGRKEVDDAMKSEYQQRFLGGFNYSSCDCPIACYNRFYEKHTDSTWNSNRVAVVKLYLSSSEREDMQEKWSYTSSVFGSDVGGILGLLLGASVLTFVQLLEIIIQKIGHYLKKFSPI